MAHHFLYTLGGIVELGESPSCGNPATTTKIKIFTSIREIPQQQVFALTVAGIILRVEGIATISAGDLVVSVSHYVFWVHHKCSVCLSPQHIGNRNCRHACLVMILKVHESRPILTSTRTSTMGLAARPGTAVLPKCSILLTRS
jgi:hypothetical protein